MKLVREKAELYSQAYEMGILADSQMEDYLVTLQELERLERVDVCQDDILRFAYEYFSDEMNPDNEKNLLPKGVTIDFKNKEQINGVKVRVGI